MSELLAVNEWLTIRTELEAVPALLTVTSKQFVPLCWWVPSLAKVAEPPPARLLLQFPNPSSYPPLTTNCADPTLAKNKQTLINTGQRNHLAHWHIVERLLRRY